MPITLQVDRAAGLVRTTVTGPFQMSEVRRYLGEAVDAKVYGYPELIDARAAEPTVWSPKVLLEAANLVRSAFGDRQVPPRAIVVDSASHFGQARVFAGFLAGDFRVAVFEDIQEAEAWLATQVADVDQEA